MHLHFALILHFSSRQERVHQELETILDKQRQLEDTNRDLRLRAGVVRRSLRDLEITSEQYSDLRILPEEELSIRDFVAVWLLACFHVDYYG